MKNRGRAKRFAKYYNQCKLPKWVTVLGIVLLAFGIVAAGVTAIFHDKYSSIFGEWESALTNVWFIAFIALVAIGAMISLGYPLLTLIGSWIWTLFAKPEPEVAEEQLVPETTEVKEEAPAVEEKAPATEQPERVIINEARLRDIFDSEFMHEWVREGKTYLDQVIEDLQFVRDNYVKGSKQDEEHFAAKHVIEIASILRKNRYFRRVYNSFTEWCCILFNCLSIEPPKRDNIKNPQEISNQVKRRFYYLLSKKE